RLNADVAHVRSGAAPQIVQPPRRYHVACFGHPRVQPRLAMRPAAERAIAEAEDEITQVAVSSSALRLRGDYRLSRFGKRNDVLPAVLGPLRWQHDRPVLDFGPSQGADLVAPLAGQREQFHDSAEVISLQRGPDYPQFGGREHALAGALLGTLG